MRSNLYVDLLIAEWGIEKSSHGVQACMRRVLGELSAESQVFLRKNPKLQVVVLPEANFSAWAYFPIHRKRAVVRNFNIRLKRGAGVTVGFERRTWKDSLRGRRTLNQNIISATHCCTCGVQRSQTNARMLIENGGNLSTEPVPSAPVRRL
jgi:hypothetical protein